MKHSLAQHTDPFQSEGRTELLSSSRVMLLLMDANALPGRARFESESEMVNRHESSLMMISHR